MSKRIQLWSGPRNISTALMYSFAQREDTKVFDEPLYGYYLKNSQASCYHPGSIEVLKSMELEGEKVVEQMMKDTSKPILFFKQMTHHLLDLDRGFMKDCKNIILTRDPKEMLPSFAKEIPNPSMQDVGYAAHLELIDHFKDRGIEFIVLDSKRILLDPEKILRTLCDALAIPWDAKMLQWDQGARPEDGVWAKFWYESVHQSTGFQKYQPKKDAFPEHLLPLLAECKPIYEKLLQIAL